MEGRPLGIFSAVVAFALLAGCAFDRTGPRPDGQLGEGPVAWNHSGWYERHLAIGGTTRWYRLYLPPSLKQGAPVVVALHGGSRSMRDMFGRYAGGPRAWLDVARDAGLLLVVPNGTNPNTGATQGNHQFWNDTYSALGAEGPMADTDDVAFLTTLVDRIKRRYPVASDRFYVTGASNGGLMTYTLLIERPDRFAAGAAFIANLPQSDSELRSPDRPTPLLLAHGTEDRVMKWQGGGLVAGPTRSAESTVAWWVQANHALAGQARSRYLPDRAPDDGCRLRETVYPAGEGGAPVVFLAMEGGGHTLPSRRYRGPDNVVAHWIFGNTCQDAEGARLAWRFMRQFSRPAESSNGL